MKFSRDISLEDTLLAEMAAAMYEPDRHQPSVSGMIRCITRTYYENEVKVTDGPSFSRRELQLFVTGLGLEKVILSGRQITQKGSTEGIQWHVDHIGTELDFIEVKSTRIKMVDSDEPKISNTWQRQVLAYFKALGITQGHFVMLHVTGDYSPPFPDIRAYNIVTTQEEVDENWQWIKNRSEVYLESVRTRVPPEPFQYNETWECEHCPWRALCNMKAGMA